MNEETKTKEFLIHNSTHSHRRSHLTTAERVQYNPRLFYPAWRVVHKYVSVQRNKLTVGEVGRGEAVVHEDTVGFSHFQVDHVRSVFQGSDGVFVAHLLQASTVHLSTDTSLLHNTLHHITPSTSIFL